MLSKTESEIRNKTKHALQWYWCANIKIMVILLGIWGLAGLGAGVLFADWLNNYIISGTGFPLGFWMAHQGSIIIFVILILIYCLFMNHLDIKHHQECQKAKQEGSI